jgi:hypothetical protein
MNRAKETLCELLVLLTLAFFVGPVPSAPAKIGYMNEGNMIRYAEFIAIVDISHVERMDPKSAFNHTEIAYATVQQTLKGRLPQTVKLHGGTWFICAQDHFAAGRYLVFLVCHQDLLMSCNDYFGIRPINGTQVEWYVPGEPVPGEPRKLSFQPLDAVLQRIRNSAAKPKENNHDA